MIHVGLVVIIIVNIYCKIVMDNYPALLEVLIEEIKYNNDTDVAQAKA